MIRKYNVSEKMRETEKKEKRVENKMTLQLLTR
jgi:hypothetical protein